MYIEIHAIQICKIKRMILNITRNYRALSVYIYIHVFFILGFVLKCRAHSGKFVLGYVSGVCFGVCFVAAYHVM